MTKQKLRALLKRLEQAYVCCKDCGTDYGIYSVGCSSTWTGTCGVCGETKPVTETRDWGYLYKGRTSIISQLKKSASSKKATEPASSPGKSEELCNKMADELEAWITAGWLSDAPHDELQETWTLINEARNLKAKDKNSDYNKAPSPGS